MRTGEGARSLLSSRLVGPLVLGTILVTLAFGSLGTWLDFERHERELQQQSRQITQRISQAVIPSIWNIYQRSVQRSYSAEAASAILDSELANAYTRAIMVYGNFGQLYMGRVRDDDGHVEQFDPIRHKAILETSDFHHAHPIRSGSITIGKVEVYFSSAAVREQFVQGLLIGALELMVLAGLFVLVLYLSLKRAMAKPLASLLLSQRTLDTMSEAVVVTDADNRIIDVNPAYSRITGYEREEVLGRDPRLSSSKHHSADFYRTIWDSLKSRGEWSGEMMDRRKSGEVYPLRMTINAVRKDSDGPLHYIGVFSDITNQKADEEQLERLAYFDPLTHLPNRSLFQDRLLQDVSSARRQDESLALFFIDLDNFKHINDSYGHLAGDELLVQISRRFSDRLRESDTLARLGGDEFTVVVKHFRHNEDLAVLANSLIAEAREPMTVAGNTVYAGASIGIALYPEDGRDAEMLIRRADAAMYHAKDKGRNQYSFFAPELDGLSKERLEQDRALHRGLENQEFELHYQPKLDLASGRLLGAEALVRWRLPDGMLAPPNEFIPLCERSGLIVDLGRWIIREACQQLRRWRLAGRADLVLAINLSTRQLKEPDLYDDIRKAIDEADIDPTRLELEITESMVMADIDASIKLLERLKSLGPSIAMDDFGTGYSSLSYLKRLPVDTLKIDRNFVSELPNDADDTAIVSAILSLAGALKLRVVAEGIELDEQHDYLAGKGCGAGQGYLYSRPLPAEDFQQKWLHGKGTDEGIPETELTT